MSQDLKIFLNIDKNIKETRITIEAPELDENIREITNFINGKEQQFLIGKKEDMQHILKPEDIQYFHTENDRVIAVTGTDSFIIKEKLYELESKLPSTKFIRISKSVIANLNQLDRFEPSFNGTLCVYFKSGKKEYVSRNFVPAIRKALKLNRR